MDEYVLAAVGRLNEAISFLALNHFTVPCIIARTLAPCVSAALQAHFNDSRGARR
jgi:hypothetical protein